MVVLNAELAQSYMAQPKISRLSLTGGLPDKDVIVFSNSLILNEALANFLIPHFSPYADYLQTIQLIPIPGPGGTPVGIYRTCDSGTRYLAAIQGHYGDLFFGDKN